MTWDATFRPEGLFSYLAHLIKYFGNWMVDDLSA